MKGRITALGIVASVALLGACGDDSSDDTGDGGALDQGSTPASLVEGVEVGVSAIDNTFRPEEIEIEAGTEVVWTNDGRNDHNVLPAEGDEWGVEVDDFAPDGVYRHRFTETGTYSYYCSLHGTTEKGMVGTIVVTG